MTRTLDSTPDNDLTFDRAGNVSVVTGLPAVAANCRTAIQAQLGEMVFARDRGMPTFATAWDRYAPVQFEAAARVILRRVEGVLGVEGFTVAREGESLAYTASIRTIFGEAAIRG